MINWKVFFAEFIGTFALVFIGAGAGAANAGLVGVALAHGLTLMVFACNCSACHFDERERGEILRNFEKDFSWRLAPLEMTGQGSELAEQLPLPTLLGISPARTSTRL